MNDKPVERNKGGERNAFIVELKFVRDKIKTVKNKG